MIQDIIRYVVNPSGEICATRIGGIIGQNGKVCDSLISAEYHSAIILLSIMTERQVWQINRYVMGFGYAVTYEQLLNDITEIKQKYPEEII